MDNSKLPYGIRRIFALFAQATEIIDLHIVQKPLLDKCKSGTTHIHVSPMSRTATIHHFSEKEQKTRVSALNEKCKTLRDTIKQRSKKYDIFGLN